MKPRTRNLLSLALGLTIAGTLTACGGGGSSSGGGSASTTSSSTGTATLTGSIATVNRQRVSMNSGLGVSTQLAYLAGQQLLAGSSAQAFACTDVKVSVAGVSTQVNGQCSFTLTGLPDGSQQVVFTYPSGTATMNVTLGAKFTTKLNNLKITGKTVTSSSHTVSNQETGETHQEVGERNDDGPNHSSNDGGRNDSSNDGGRNDSSNDGSRNNSETSETNHSSEGSEGSNDCVTTSSGCVHV